MNLRSLFIGILLGLYMGWVLFARQSETARITPPDSKAVPSTKRSAAPAKDPLIEIEGIGPAYELDLNRLGIFTFAQLGEQNADELAGRMTARVTAERIRRENWIEQAQARAK